MVPIEYLNYFVISYIYYIHIYVVVNFFYLTRKFFSFCLFLFLGMVKYANEVETKEKENISPEIKNKLQHISD